MVLDRMVLEMYWLQWMSEKEIADALGFLNPASVGHIMRKNGWPVRSPSEGLRLFTLSERARKAKKANMRAIFSEALEGLRNGLWERYGVQEHINETMPKEACGRAVC